MKEIFDTVFIETEKIIGMGINTGIIQDELSVKIDNKVKVDLYWKSLFFLDNIKKELYQSSERGAI